MKSITQEVLKEFLKIEQQIRSLDLRRQAIRKNILAQRRKKLTVGEFLVTVTDFIRKIPAHIQEGKRVSVKVVYQGVRK